MTSERTSCLSCGAETNQPCDRSGCPNRRSDRGAGLVLGERASCRVCGLRADSACSAAGCPQQHEAPAGVAMDMPACPSCGSRTGRRCDRAVCARG